MKQIWFNIFLLLSVFISYSFLNKKRTIKEKIIGSWYEFHGTDSSEPGAFMIFKRGKEVPKEGFKLEENGSLTRCYTDHSCFSQNIFDYQLIGTWKVEDDTLLKMIFYDGNDMINEEWVILKISNKKLKLHHNGAVFE